MTSRWHTGSPLAKLVAVHGKVLMVEAPMDTITLLHHSEHLAQIPGQPVVRYEVPFAAGDGEVEWRMTEEFDTSTPVVAGLDEDHFATIATAFLAAGQGAQGMIGAAPIVLVEAAAITAFAVDWPETRFRAVAPTARRSPLVAAGTERARPGGLSVCGHNWTCSASSRYTIHQQQVESSCRASSRPASKTYAHASCHPGMRYTTTTGKISPPDLPRSEVL